MPGPKLGAVVCCLSAVLVVLCSCGGGGSSSSSFPTGSVQLSVQASGGGGGMVSSNPAGINCGQACSASFSSGTQVTLSAFPTANSFFAGWSGACNGTGVCKVTLTQNTSVMANFSTSPTLTVALSGTGSGSVSSNPSGINCGTTCSATFDPGTMVTLIATAAANSSFAGWAGGGCASSPTCVVTLSASEKVTATFAANQSASVLTVSLAGTGKGTVTSSPSGINCGTTCSASYISGTQVTLTETAVANSYFIGWGGACSAGAVNAASQQVIANFGTEPVLSVSLGGTGTGTVTSTPAGINCGTTCSASFIPGTQVTLTETAVANSYFIGWGGACSASGVNSTCTVTLTASQQVIANFGTEPVLSVSLGGSGTGTVTSTPAGINCGTTCSASFPPQTQVTLTETPGANSLFGGWGGACSSSGTNSTCTLTLSASQQVSATFNGANISLVNHIIFMSQENRSFDSYFGAMREYWAENGYPDQPFDGLPQFNPGGGQPPTNPGCNPSNPPPDGCVFDPNNPVTSFHLITQCVEDMTASWNQGHMDWNYLYPEGQQPATLNGFVWNAAEEARSTRAPRNDKYGLRTMGYYDGGDLNYYYFMASNFATSDRWFNPMMSRTGPNRTYLIGATSQGYAYPVGTHANDKASLTAPTIFQELQAAGISWKIYVNPTSSSCTGPPYDPACLIHLSHVANFVWGQSIPTVYPHNLGTIGIVNSDFDNDLANGTLPQVAEIENAADAGLDEHPSASSDLYPVNIQLGARYVSSIINALMASAYWKDSAFVLTYDENGGAFDHVSPQPEVSPDGIKPVDLAPGDICTQTTGPTCDFVYTGYRVPLIVVSPYARKNYVSHTVADYTAILKFIETRFNLQPLNHRDAAQMDMTEFFDFDNPAWMTPPTPPAQNTSGPCYLDHLP